MLDAAGSSVQVTHNLCNHLAGVGCEVHVFTAPHWERSAGSSEKRYQTHVVFYRGTQIRSYEAGNVVTRTFWKTLRLAQHLRAMLGICLRARNFDVVHTQILPVPWVDYFCLRVIRRRTPVVCTVHELVPHMSRFRGLTGRFFEAIYRLADRLFVFTNYTRNRLISEQGITPEKIVVVPHGSLEHTAELAAGPLQFPMGPVPTVLFIGNIRPDKGLDVLIQAAAHLRKKVPSFKVLIAGRPGFDMTAIRDSVKKLGLEDFVEFDLRFLGEQDFAAYLSAATVVALPYRRIEQSGVAVAACTFGKAIVATRCGGVEELVTEAGNGLLVPMDDAEAFAEALGEVLLDVEKRKSFERNSRKYAAQALSWEPIARKTVAGYEAALKHRADIRMRDSGFRREAAPSSLRASDGNVNVAVADDPGPIARPR